MMHADVMIELPFVFAVNFSFLLQLDEWLSHELSSASSDGQRALDMTLHTLRMMAVGGMHDHVGQVRIGCFVV